MLKGTNVADKKTGFDRATESNKVEVIEDDVESRSPVPRAVFTRETNLDLSKLQIGSLRVAQGMTLEVKDRKAAIGQFVLTNFPAYDEVIIVPFGAPDIRVYKPDQKGPVLCNAPTGDFGFGNPGGVCKDCSLSHWGELNPMTGKSSPPPCKEGVMVRAYSITHRCIVDIQFLAGDRSKGGFIQAQSLSLGWGNFCIKLTTVAKSNDKGSWFIPQIEMLNEIPEEHRDFANKWYEVYCASLSESKDEAIRHLSAGS